jgi:hypothetical protein
MREKNFKKKIPFDWQRVKKGINAKKDLLNIRKKNALIIY